MAVLSRDPTAAPQTPTTREHDGLTRELAVAAAVLVVVGGLILGGHVLHGGLYTDDWPIALINAQHGLSALIHNVILGDNSRPLAAIYLGLTGAATGTDGSAHAVVGLAVHILACWSLYWLLRTATMTRWQAGAVSALLLLFPFADASWLWFAVTQSAMSLSLMLFGLITLIYGVRSEGSRLVVLHMVAAVLLAASVLLYETSTAVAIVGAAAIEFTHARWRPACARTLAVIAAIVLAVVVPRIPGVLPGADPHQGLSLSQQAHHARLIADQSFTVLTSSAIPFGAAHRNVVIPIIALIVVLALVAWMRAPRGSAERIELGRWLCWLLVGVVVVAAAYVVFVDTDFSYQPAFEGAANRMNVVAAVGYCLIVYSVAMLAALLISGRGGIRPKVALAIVSVAALAVAVGYAQRSRGDVHTWDRAAAIQHNELARLSSSLGGPAPGTTIFAFGGAGQVASNVYAFGVTWDLNSAVKLHWGDPTLQAYPIFAGTTFICGPSSVTPSGFWNSAGSPPPTVAYGHVVFFDWRTARSMLVRTRQECLRAASEFKPGPLQS